MWLFTPDGFFSAVQHRDDPDTLIIRGRFPADIERLAHALGTEVVLTPTADYPVRTYVNRERWAGYVAAAARAIDYDNFKNAVTQTQGHGRHQTYLEVWSVLRGAEDSQAREQPDRDGFAASDRVTRDEAHRRDTPPNE